MKRLNKRTRLVSLLTLTFIFWSIWNTYRSIDIGEKKLTTLRRNDYVSIFVADISRNIRRRIERRTSIVDDAVLRDNLEICAHCRPGGKADGGVDLNKNNGFCTEWCSVGNYCGKTKTYMSSPKSVDCTMFDGHAVHKSDIVYDLWWRDLERHHAYGKAALDILTCMECRSGDAGDGGVARFRNEFCDQSCSTSPKGNRAGYCGTSIGYRGKDSTNCQFMSGFHTKHMDEIISNWINLLSRQAKVNTNDESLIEISNKFLWCASCDVNHCFGHCVLGHDDNSKCITKGLDGRTADHKSIDCRSFRHIFQSKKSDIQWIDLLVSKLIKAGAPSLPSIDEKYMRLCRERCTRSGLLISDSNNRKSCHRFCDPRAGYCSNLDEQLVDCHAKLDSSSSSSSSSSRNSIVVTVPERQDRLGSYLQIIYGLRFLAANFKSWTPRSGHCETGQMLDGGRVKIPVAKVFGWNSPCFDLSSVIDCEHLKSSLATRLCETNTPSKLNIEDVPVDGTLTSGFYIVTQPWSIIRNLEVRRGKAGSIFSPKNSKMLRDEFLQSPYREAERDRCVFCMKSHTFEDNVVNVAVHVRRGDISSNSGRYSKAFVSDETFLTLIHRIARALHTASLRTRVIIFSEAYGETDWSKWSEYLDNVNEIESFTFRLSGTHGSNDDNLSSKSSSRREARETLHTELSDIHDFVVSDILIVGGTFSAIAGILRPPEVGTTFYLKSNHGYFGYERDLSPSWWIGFDRKGSSCDLLVVPENTRHLQCVS